MRKEEKPLVVEFDEALKETIYSIGSESCQLRWIVYGSEANKGVVGNCSKCNLPLSRQLPMLSSILGRVLEDNAGTESPFRTLFWGRLAPDTPHDDLMPLRLAIAAKRSPLWDVARGRPRSGNVNLFVRNLANEAMIYGELRDLFEKFQVGIEISSVEKVLISRADKLPFFDRLREEGTRPADRLPFDCMTWFSWRPRSPQ